MLKQIIINELNKRLGRTATTIEQRDAYWNAVDMFDNNDTIADLKATMDDYVDNTYVRCDKCGEMHRREDVSEICGPYGVYKVCTNPDCEQEASYDAHNDRHRDQATH
ncbi:MAG: hypothetical protein IKD78_12735 [Bacteroidales bacterium]|nr:hypothetical protein [Bacteroidales bacterium]